MYTSPLQLPGLLISCWVLLATIAGCDRQQTDPLYDELLATHNDVPITEDLGPGDKIAIQVLHEEALSGEFTVSPAGTISYPYVGRIDVSDKTCLDVEDSISAGLRDGYLANPSVSCSILEYNSKRIFVFGEVQTTGAFPYRANSTVVDAIAQAGGFKPRAEGNQTRLKRVVDGTLIQVKVPAQDIIEGTQQDIRLMPGDVIYVPPTPW